MSHFVILALLPPDTAEHGIQERLNALLAPYDEGVEVDPYEEPCWCVGQAARTAAREHAERVAPLDPVREELQAEVEAALAGDERIAKVREALEYDPAGSTVSEEDLAYYHRGSYEAIAEARGHDGRWAAAVARNEGAETEALAAHPDREKADPGCEECRGSGKTTTTYNPKSQWDWWTVGGRWNGMLLGEEYSIVGDEKSYQACSMCRGTGRRSDRLGRETREKHPGYSCNVCRGSGKEMIFPANLPEPPGGGNWRPVREIPESAQIPYAVLTPDGEWHQKGKMMMFGMSRDDMPAEDWAARVRSIYGDYQDHLAVVVDCHV